MSDSEIVIEFESVEELEQEFDSNLCHGGTFARGAGGFEQTQPCDVVLVHPADGEKMTLAAQIVMVVPEGENRGVGIALSGFDAAVREKLEAFVKNHRGPSDDGNKQPQNLHARLRGMSVVEQHKVARGPNVTDRVALERIYGKSVWEMLLHNPRLTIPEVSRIARMGTIPRPLLETIVSNSTWLNTPHVRRALLGNPRVTGEMVNKILRVMPRNELRLVPKQTSYPSVVRNAARKFIK
ncbi:MAG: hypothetical protein GY854_26755 [Deltaproteobacteria bacterium]|nr:hypothetical protein [Deltaproteobacteria bacterium]